MKDKIIDVNLMPDGRFKIQVGEHRLTLDDKEIGRLVDYCVFAIQDKEVSGEDDSNAR